MLASKPPRLSNGRNSSTPSSVRERTTRFSQSPQSPSPSPSSRRQEQLSRTQLRQQQEQAQLQRNLLLEQQRAQNNQSRYGQSNQRTPPSGNAGSGVGTRYNPRPGLLGEHPSAKGTTTSQASTGENTGWTPTSHLILQQQLQQQQQQPQQPLQQQQQQQPQQRQQNPFQSPSSTSNFSSNNSCSSTSTFSSANTFTSTSNQFQQQQQQQQQQQPFQSSSATSNFSSSNTFSSSSNHFRPVFVAPKSQPQPQPQTTAPPGFAERPTPSPYTYNFTPTIASDRLPRGLVANLPCPWDEQQAQNNNNAPNVNNATAGFQHFQPTSQSESHSASQTAPQRVSQPAFQIASQSASQPASQPASQTASQRVSQTASQSASQRVSQTASQSASQPASQSASQTTPQTAAQTTPQTAAQTTPQTAAQTTPQTAAQTTPQTAAQTTPQTAAQTTPQTAAQTTPQTASQTTPQTAAQTTPQTAAQTTPQTAAQTTPHTAAQTTPQTAAQTTPQTAAQTTPHASSQTTSRTASQSASQTTSQSQPSPRSAFNAVFQSVSRRAPQTSQAASQSASLSASRSASKSTSRTATQSASRSASRSTTSKTTSRTVPQKAPRPASRSVSHSASHSASHLASQSASQSASQPTSQPASAISRPEDPPAEPYNGFAQDLEKDKLQVIKDQRFQNFEKELEYLRMQWQVDSLKQETVSSYSTLLQSLDSVVETLDPGYEKNLITPKPPWFTEENRRRQRRAVNRATPKRKEKSSWDWTNEDLSLSTFYDMASRKVRRARRSLGLPPRPEVSSLEEESMNNFYDSDDDIPVRASQSVEDNTKQSADTVFQPEDTITNDKEASRHTLAVERLSFMLHEKLQETVQVSTERYRALNIGLRGEYEPLFMAEDVQKPDVFCSETQTDHHFGCDSCGRSFRKEAEISDFSTGTQTDSSCLSSTKQAMSQTKLAMAAMDKVQLALMPKISVLTQTIIKTQTVPCQTVSLPTLHRTCQTPKFMSVHRKTQTCPQDAVSVCLQTDMERVSIEVQTLETRVNTVDMETQTNGLILSNTCQRTKCIVKATDGPAPSAVMHPIVPRAPVDGKDVIMTLIPFLMIILILAVFGPVALALCSFTHLLLSLASLRHVVDVCCRLPEIAAETAALSPVEEADPLAVAVPARGKSKRIRNPFSAIASWYLEVAAKASIVKQTLINMIEQNQYATIPWNPHIQPILTSHVDDPGASLSNIGDPETLLKEFCHHRGIDVDMMLGPQASSFLMNAPMWLAELVAVGASDVSSLTRHVYRDLREAMGIKETPDVSFLQHPDSRYMLYWLARARGEAHKLYMTVTKHQPQHDAAATSHFNVTLCLGRIQQSVCGTELSAEAVSEAEEQAAALLFHKLLFTWLRISYKKPRGRLCARPPDEFCAALNDQAPRPDEYCVTDQYTQSEANDRVGSHGAGVVVSNSNVSSGRLEVNIPADTDAWD